MPGVARKGTDTAGSTILAGSDNVIVNGAGAARIGDAVQGHGRAPHSSPKLSQGSATVIVNGVGISRQGDQATCGHAATGSGDVIAG